MSTGKILSLTLFTAIKVKKKKCCSQHTTCGVATYTILVECVAREASAWQRARALIEIPEYPPVLMWPLIFSSLPHRLPHRNRSQCYHECHVSQLGIYVYAMNVDAGKQYEYNALSMHQH